jgi:DegV family protein with EDD domain
MAVRIVTDSTCDLPSEIAAEHGIIVVPTCINIGGRSYLDGVEISREEFYDWLPTLTPAPTTAAPGIGVFLQAFEQAANEGATGIIAVHPPAELSSLYSVAAVAAKEMHDLPIVVIDSRQVTLGMGSVVLAAARMAAVGRTADEIAAALPDVIRRTYVFGVLDTLEYLRRGGRASRIQAGLSALLQIKPVFTVYDGQITFERVRTRSAAMTRLVASVEELGPLEALAVAHTHAPDRAAALTEMGRHLFPDGQPTMCVEVTPVLGVHFGPDAVGFLAVKRET